MALPIAPMPLDELVDLVNEWGTLPRELDGEGRDGSDAELTALADELHPIFASVADRAEKINRLLVRAQVRPTLTEQDGRLTPAWLVDDPAQSRRAAAALALRDHPDRIGVCADRQCADVYVDASPAGRRRFCCLTCQNRARAEAFRKRRAG